MDSESRLDYRQQREEHPGSCQNCGDLTRYGLCRTCFDDLPTEYQWYAINPLRAQAAIDWLYDHDRPEEMRRREEREA